MISSDLYNKIKTSERLEKESLISFIDRAWGYYEKCWKDIDADYGLFGELNPQKFNMNYLHSSSPVIEYVVRPHVQILVSVASLLDASKRDIISKEKDEKLIRYLRNGINWMCKTHITGDMDVEQFLERKRWGENWGSSLWASMLAIASFYGKEFIEEDLYDSVCKVVFFEAERFIDTFPPNGRRGDSKAVETAKDVMVIAWAIALNPKHENLEKLENALKIYSLNVASTIYDHGDFSELDGHAINSYISTVTMHPDYTLESHGFFHPEFLSYTQWISASVLAFTVRGKEVPSYFARKAHDMASERFLGCCVSNGYPWPVGGQDWPLWMLRPYSFAYSLWRENRIALKKLLNLLSLLADFQERNNDGRFLLGMDYAQGGWVLDYESQISYELAMLYFTPFAKDLILPSAGRFERAQDDNQRFPYVQVMVRRNGKVFRSFSWNNFLKQPCAYIIPQANPMLVGISEDSLIGDIKIEGQDVKPKIIYHKETTFREGFETSGKILYYGNNSQELLSREIRVFTWSDDGLLIFDKIIALSDINLLSEETSPLYIVNDDITGNTINIVSGSFEESINGLDGQKAEYALPNSWVSIEDTLLYQVFWGAEKGLVYRKESQKKYPNYWKNMRQDKVFMRTRPGNYKQGEILHQFGLYVGLGKGPRFFKVNGTPKENFKGLILMEGKNTLAL